MILVYPDISSVAQHVSNALVTAIRDKPDAVLGLATGGTMEPVYDRFIRQVRDGQLDISRVTTFNLDEYVGLDAQHPQSYAWYMQDRLFRHLPFTPSRCHLPDGTAPDAHACCEHYLAMIRDAGGIDLQLLGVGGNGHIGFNEPGTPFDSRCHVVKLSERTRIDNSRFFAPDELVPESAVTMGLQDIMEARRIVLVATGPNKATTLAKYHHYGVTEQIPFTLLKQHPNVELVLDAAAASRLPQSAYRLMA